MPKKLFNQRKTAYIHLRDHRDPIWNKGFREQFYQGHGPIVRSYSEREALQIDRWLDILPGTKAVFQQEITYELKAYLQDNPEKKAKVQELVRSGNYEFLGGGSTILDYNCTHGESMYRNFLYSIRWIQNEFNIRPAVAGCYDAFGLSAQMPQIFQQFGFDWLPIYIRIFGHHAMGMEIDAIKNKPVKDYWQGLDGSLLCIKHNFLEHGQEHCNIMTNIQYSACPQCLGEGCRFCHFSGMTTQAEQFGTGFDKAFRDLKESDYHAGRFVSHTEETIKSLNYMTELETCANNHDINIQYLSFTQIKNSWAKKKLDRLRNNEVSSDEIDIREEGNPIGTGCYTVRSILKRENRAIEHLLMDMEKAATIAHTMANMVNSPGSFTYPRQSIMKLWEDLNLTQAHDAITGNHPDAAFSELRSIQRRIKSQAARLYFDALTSINNNIETTQLYSGENYTEHIIFNPHAWNVDSAQSELIIRFPQSQSTDVDNWSVYDNEGNKLLILDWSKEAIHNFPVYRIRFICPTLPPCGFTSVHCNAHINQKQQHSNITKSPIKDAEAAGLEETTKNKNETAKSNKFLKAQDAALISTLNTTKKKFIENEFYLIETNDKGIASIIDKRNKRVIAEKGSFDLIAEDDIGSYWECLQHFHIRKNISSHSNITVELLNGEYQEVHIRGELQEPLHWKLPNKWNTKLRLCRDADIRTMTEKEARVCIHSLQWEHRIRLIPGKNEIQCRTLLNCNSENIHIHLPFKLGFKTKNDEAWYNIPYGAIKRSSYKAMNAYHLSPDGEWPAIHYVAVENVEDNYSVGLLNRGIPAHRFYNGELELHLLRSPRINVWGSRSAETNSQLDPLAKDIGLQEFNFSLFCENGEKESLHIERRGYEFNSDIISFKREYHNISNNKTFPRSQSFLSCDNQQILIPVIKLAEDNDAVIMRSYEGLGKETEASITSHWQLRKEIDPMEKAQQNEVKNNTIQFKPFEIKTLSS